MAAKGPKSPVINEYGEDMYVKTLSQSLRKISSDNTPVSGKYVSFNRDVVDMITPDGVISSSKVKDITYDKKNKTITIFKEDGSKITLSTDDNYLTAGNYDSNAKTITLKMEDGSTVTVPTVALENKFYTQAEIQSNYYTQEQVDQKIIENSNYWGEF